jgi:hypothetical protein
MRPTLKSAFAGLGARSVHVMMVRAGIGVTGRAGCESFAVRDQYCCIAAASNPARQRIRWLRALTGLGLVLDDCGRLSGREPAASDSRFAVGGAVPGSLILQ